MKPIIRRIFCALAVGAAGWGLVRAALPEGQRLTGKVLILANERTLEGDIQRIGEDYRVRRAVGEVWVPGAKVLRLCGSWPDAYLFLRSRANLADPDERLRLARWCQLHGLRKEGLSEAEAAATLRPNSLEARRLVSLFRRAVAVAPPPVSKPRPAAPTPVVQAPAVDLSAECLGLFTNRIQPILMNTCARCHSNGRGGRFTLLRSYQGGVNRQATQHNLAAVLAQIDTKRPQVSPLLIKAVSRHGNDDHAPLKGRQTPAFHLLQEWVEKTLADNPQLRDGSAAAEAGGGPPEARVPGRSEPAGPSAENVGTFRPAAPANPGAPVVAAVVSMAGPGPGKEPPVQAAPQAVGANPPPARLTPKAEAPPPTPVDPFDPLIFNQQMHPERVKAQ